MIKTDFKPRLYQQTIFHTCTNHNTMVVLPTGLGKTAISVLLASQRMKQYPESKIVILAPTKPLLDQHLATFMSLLEGVEEKCVVFSGSVLPAKRKLLWEQNQFIFSTPQTLENDILNNRIALKNVSMICVDEAHRAVGDYSYVFLCQNYLHEGKFPRIIGLTASPGSDMEKINEVITNLGIEKIEVRTESDPDVKEYVQPIDVHYELVDLPPEFMIIHKFLQFCYLSKLRQIKQHGLLREVKNMTKTQLLGMQASFQRMIMSGEKDFAVLKSISLCAEALKVEHALSMLETQGIPQMMEYSESLEAQARARTTKAVRNLVNDPNFRAAVIKAKHFSDLLHPKVEILLSILKEKIKTVSKIIIFTQFRDTAIELESLLEDIDPVKAKLFFGQASKKGRGMSQKEQKQVLEEFRKGMYNVLVMTSVGEEGLDIPQVDLVIFYEPVPSAIRTVQRRGRTGRLQKGEVIILVARNTRDEGIRWAAHHKEKRMYRNLKSLQGLIPSRKEKSLDQFDEKLQYRIYADSREKHSSLLKWLYDRISHVELRRLDIADYLVSQDVAIERKAVKDFVDSIIDGRLLSQVKQLKEQYQKPLIIVEGEEDIYSQRNINPAAIRGMIATITVDYGIPLLWTKNAEETGAYILSLASREQDEKQAYFSPHAAKPKSPQEQQVYIVSAFPMISGTLAKEILKKFGSIERFMSASKEKLLEIPLLGEKKADFIRDIINRSFEEDKK